ncbi:TlpA family protein disulfide reductase, partial [Beggiatoa alba]|nr:TlpA family protein disulfide reductase [Beggiatoa alba]
MNTTPNCINTRIISMLWFNLITPCLAISLLVVSSSLFASETVSIQLNPEIETELTVQTAPGKTVLLVIPSEHGLQQADYALLQTLPHYNVEVWLSNILESYFLSNSARNLEKIPPQDIQTLITAIHKRTKKNIIVLSSGRGAVPLLRGLASWPAKFSPDYLTGLILMHPKLFTKTPEPGLVPELIPSVKSTNQLIFLIQPKLSPFWWNRQITLSALEKSGSDVFLQPLKNTRNRFYFREDATDYEHQLRKKYPNLIYKAITQLTRFPKTSRPTVKNFQAQNQVTSKKSQRRLSNFKGKKITPPLELKTLSNQLYRLNDDINNVILVNFWASWCPPCVHEMPSMQKLDDYFNKDYAANKKNRFKIIAVNMAEDKKTIRTFLETKVSVK